jgi:hypothetical protein
VLSLLMLFLLISILSSPRLSTTLDEPLHYHYGLLILEGNSNRIDDSSMPVSALNALPDHVSALLPVGLLKSVLERFFVARLVTILFSLMVAFLVFWWSHALYGFVPAIFATVLYALDPNIIAHSQLVTTDVFLAGMVALSSCLLWKFANSRSTSVGLMCAVALGLSQLVKYTALALYPLGFLALFVHDWPSIRDSYRAAGIRGLGPYAGQLGIYSAVVLISSTFIINLGFLFNRTLTPVKDYQFRSEVFRTLQASFPALDNIRVPVPYPYLQGLDWILETDRAADRFGNIYLLGHISKPQGFPGYYFVASLLKMPIATQIIVLGALIAYLRSKGRSARFFKDEIFLLLPVAFFTIYLNFFFNAQTGIRYYLVIFPLLYVFAGSLFVGWEGLRPTAKAAGVLLLLYLSASVLSYFPYYIPYFNELVLNKTQTYRFLSDSNLDWGQGTDDLARYLSEHKDAIYDPAQVEAGRLVVGGSDLVGVLESPERYAWLRDNFEPVGTVAYCYFIYQISPQEIARLCARTGYCK